MRIPAWFQQGFYFQNGALMNMYLGNLHYNVTEDELRDLFSEFGEVVSVNIVMDRYTKQSKGFGFVDMPNNSEADKAIKALNGNQLKGQSLKVSQAEPRRKRSRRRRF
jgi:RNA recognition motif-containing protein